MTFQVFKDFDALQSFCDSFDEEHDCNTFFTRIPFEEIRTVLNRPYEHEDIHTLATVPFEKRSIVYSNDLDVPESPLGKLNSLFLMMQSLRHKRKFFAPMSVCIYPEDVVVHPGNTRLLISHLYHHKVDIMITDFTNTLDIRQKKILYNPNLTSLHYNHCQADDQYMPKHFRGRPYWFKQFADHVTNTGNMSFHVPRTIDPPRKYEKIADTVLVNGDVILREIEGVWKVVLE
jgi:hypothetical protein